MCNDKFSDVSETRKSGRAFSRAERKNCQIQIVHQETKSSENEEEMKIFKKKQQQKTQEHSSQACLRFLIMFLKL